MVLRCGQHQTDETPEKQRLPKFPTIPPAWIIPQIEKKKDDPRPRIEIPAEPNPFHPPGEKKDDDEGGVIIIKITRP